MPFYAGTKVYHRLSAIVLSGPIFCIDNGTSKCFVRFDDHDDFEIWYSKLRPCKRTLSEVITSDMRKLILDIDSPDDAVFEKMLMYDFERHITSRIHDVFFTLGIGKPDVIFFDMCSDDKISYHAVVSNFAFSAQTCMGLCDIISYGQIWGNFVDRGVYKMTQFMRIENSTKFGERRWKERLTGPGAIREGLLSDTQNVKASDVTAHVHRSPARNFLGVNIPSEMLGQFRTGKVNKYGFLPLYRKKPGFCIQCNRIHHNENAVIKYYAGNPVFVCWRRYYTGKKLDTKLSSATVSLY